MDDPKTAARWVSAWSTSPIDASLSESGVLDRLGVAVTDVSARTAVLLTAGGTHVRLTLSNIFGVLPLHVAACTIAIGADDARGIDPATLHTVTFGGQTHVRIGAGESCTSDAAALPVAAGQTLAVTVFYRGINAMRTIGLIGGCSHAELGNCTRRTLLHMAVPMQHTADSGAYEVIPALTEIDVLAATVPDSGGVVVVPAFTGLGAPYWDMYARGAILGVTRGTGRAHIARAVLSCIAAQVTDLMLAMRQDAGCDIALLRAGGAEISATPRGYVLPRATDGITRTIACRHALAQTGQELDILVDNGCTVLDVIVEHPVYGQLTGQLQISSRYDVEQFLARIRDSEAAPLSMLTGGLHLHTLCCPNEDAYTRACAALKAAGLLLGD